MSEEQGVWTLDKMRIRLLSEEGIAVTPQAIWYRLRESRWSWKTGRPSNPEGNDQEREAFKKTVWVS